MDANRVGKTQYFVFYNPLKKMPRWMSVNCGSGYIYQASCGVRSKFLVSCLHSLSCSTHCRKQPDNCSQHLSPEFTQKTWTHNTWTHKQLRYLG